MGFYLRPGHKDATGKQGWVETSRDEFIRDIEIGSLELGNWGESKIESNGMKDAYSPLYSIPNPWAAAHLYHHVLNDTTHSLAKPLIQALLNLLKAYSIDRTVELKKFDFPLTDEQDTLQFNKFWDMAPEFIKYGTSMYVFVKRDNKKDKIVGGLSKSTIIWVSQQYSGEYNLDYFKEDSKIIKLIQILKDGGYSDPLFDIEQNYWGHGILNTLYQSNGEGGFVSANKPLLPVLVEHAIPESDFYDEATTLFVFNNASLDKSSTKIIKNKINPKGLLEKIKEEKSGDTLPMNLGANKWVIIDSLLEKEWICLPKAAKADDNAVLLLEKSKGYLYPVTPDYIKRYHFNLEDLLLTPKGINIGDSETTASADMLWKTLPVNINDKVKKDLRSIAVWPPFASEFSETFILEHNVEGIDKYPKLEFYDSTGQTIQISSVELILGKELRIYRTANKNVFPTHIRVKSSVQSGGGFIKLNHRAKAVRTGKLNVGLDFGTSHTAIAYNLDGVIQMMNFQNSQPIVIGGKAVDDLRLTGLFLPIDMSKRPATADQYKKNTPWQPFQTQWLHFREQYHDCQPIVDGIIPFLLTNAYTPAGGQIKNDLKWGSEKDEIITYRKLFLKQLLLMIQVESEAIGCDELVLKWSYPKAFSVTQYGTLSGFWQNVALELKEGEN